MIEITYVHPLKGLQTVKASEVPEWVLYDTAEERREAAEAVVAFDKWMNENWEDD